MCESVQQKLGHTNDSPPRPQRSGFAQPKLYLLLQKPSSFRKTYYSKKNHEEEIRPFSLELIYIKAREQIMHS